MKLSACLIVKNEAVMLAKTLPNLSKNVDEIILLDTGSTDNTIAVAEQFGAQIYHFTWIDDFAAARNESLKYATGDWIIWVDADEYLLESDLQQLRQSLEQSKANAGKVTLYEAKLGTCERTNGYAREKVFRNKLGWHFIRPINEQLVDGSGQVVAGEIIPVAIYHWGKDLSEVRMKEKRAKYVELYSKAINENPRDPYLQYLLGNRLEELVGVAEALPCYIRASELGKRTAIGIKALAKKAEILLKLKKLPEALQVAQELIVVDPQNISARNVLASICLVTGQLDQAIQLSTEALNLKLKDLDVNLFTTKAMPNFLLGRAYELKGEKELAQTHYRLYKEIAG